LPVVGVNTFRNPHGDPVADTLELARSTDDEKQSQLKRLAEFQQRHAAESSAMLRRLQQAVIENRNVFEVLMEAVRCCSLGQITNALFEVGGQYRRSMCPGVASRRVPSRPARHRVEAAPAAAGMCWPTWALTYPPRGPA
jgi:hypothetical protein